MSKKKKKAKKDAPEKTFVAAATDLKDTIEDHFVARQSPPVKEVSRSARDGAKYEQDFGTVGAIVDRIAAKRNDRDEREGVF